MCPIGPYQYSRNCLTTYRWAYEQQKHPANGRSRYKAIGGSNKHPCGLVMMLFLKYQQQQQEHEQPRCGLALIVKLGSQRAP